MAVNNGFEKAYAGSSFEGYVDFLRNSYIDLEFKPEIYVKQFENLWIPAHTVAWTSRLNMGSDLAKLIQNSLIVKGEYEFFKGPVDPVVVIPALEEVIPEMLTMTKLFINKYTAGSLKLVVPAYSESSRKFFSKKAQWYVRDYARV